MLLLLQMSTTPTGNTCQLWALDTPHSHGYNWVSADHNYCRNPDGSARPWCYTTNPAVRWEYCDDIPLCTDPPPAPPSEPPSPMPPHAPYGTSMGFCESPVGGDTTTVDTTVIGNFDLGMPIWA